MSRGNKSFRHGRQRASTLSRRPEGFFLFLFFPAQSASCRSATAVRPNKRRYHSAPLPSPPLVHRLVSPSKPTPTPNTDMNH